MCLDDDIVWSIWRHIEVHKRTGKVLRALLNITGVKEGRIRMAEFGQEIPEAFSKILEQTGMSEKKFQEWGKAVASGGEDGAKAMGDMVTWLNSIEDDTLRNSTAAEIFGTMWEDQGTNLTSVFQGIDGAVDQTKNNTDGLNDSISKLDQDPTVQFREALNNMMIALAPVMQKVAEVVTKVTEWAAANPTLVATITAIVAVVGILMGIFIALVPILTAISALAGILGVSFAAVAAPVLIIIAVIAALIAIGVALYKNWDTIKAKTSEVWGKIKSTISEVWNSVKSKTSETWNNIKSSIVNKTGEIKSSVSSKFEEVKQSMQDKIEQAKEKVRSIIEKIKGFFTGLKLKLPKIEMPKLPHFSIKGSFSLNPPSVPKLGVDWYDKGGVFYGPQVIGVGEKRPEFVGALDDLRGIVRQAMTDVTGKGSVSTSTNHISFANMISGPIHIREEADIDKLSVALSKKVAKEMRSNGVIRR